MTVAVWSFWSKPAHEGAYRSGWPSMSDHLQSWILSLQTCRRFFRQTRLVTDTAGAALLIDELGLDFDDVSIELDALAGADPDLWALGKLHAYRAQTAPFLHIDSDVYMWQPPLPPGRGAPLAGVQAAYPEYKDYGNSVYRCASLKADLRRFGGWIPEELDAYVPIGGVLQAENCGVLGGTRLDFLTHYAAQAIRLVEDQANQLTWARRRPMMADMLIFEQHFLSACLAFHRHRPGSPFEDIGVGYLFPSEGEAFANGGRAGFTHVISDTKRNPAILERLAARVQRDYPALHDRCRDLCLRL